MTRALLQTQITQNEECISTKTIPNQSPSAQASILAWHREQQCQSWFHQRSRATGHTHIPTYTRTDCCCSVAKLYPTLCSPMDSSTPGLPVPHHLPEFAQVHVHWIDDAIQPSQPLSPSSAFNVSQHQGLFQWVGCLHQVAKVLEFQLQYRYIHIHIYTHTHTYTCVYYT